MMNAVHICSFQSADTVTRKTKYEDLKAVILAAGRFSTFEASENHQAARMFDRLERDPEIETFDLGYPWKGVRWRVESDNLVDADGRQSATFAGGGVDKDTQRGGIGHVLVRAQVPRLKSSPIEPPNSRIGTARQQDIIPRRGDI